MGIERGCARGDDDRAKRDLPCGRGEKYKKCCLRADEAKHVERREAAAPAAAVVQPVVL